MVTELPYEWTVRRLSEVADVRDGTHESPKYVSEGIPLITSKNLKPWGLDFEDVKFISEDDHRQIEKRSKVDNGDILFGMIGTIGNTVLVEKEFDFSIKNVALVKFPTNIVDRKFIYYLLQSSSIKKQFERVSDGGVQKFVALGTIRSLEIPVPDIKEQRKIAAILTSIDDAITATQRIIDQTEVVKRGLMQQLLTKGIGHTTFKETEIGEIPTEWDVKTLEEIGTWSGGGTPSKSQPNYWASSGNGVLWVSPKDMSAVVIADSQDKITEVGRSEKGLSLLPIGTILIVTRSGILRNNVPIALAGKELTINQDLKSLKVNQELNHKYVFYTLKAFDEKLRLSCVKSGTTVESIDFPSLKSMQIPVPPRHEQDKIASIAEKFHTKQANEQQYLSELRRLKQGLIQVLLTGKVRVNVVEPSEVSV